MANEYCNTGDYGSTDSSSAAEKEFPLHYYAWKNNYTALDRALDSGQYDKEAKDPRGRTPLMLAVTLGHLESTKVLLKYNCNVAVENAEGWSVVQEATATGDPELLSAVLENRDAERYTNRMSGITRLLSRLSEAPDFYVEMTWEFTSWVPLVSRMCPSDTYRVYKRGSNVRIDTTLLGFDQTQWQRGSRSYIFKGLETEASMIEVDHDSKQVFVERIHTVDTNDICPHVRPGPAIISHRLTNPIVTNYVNTEKINFERDKSGIWGWRSDRTENVNGYDCKVFSASNVELVTKTRTEHQTDEDKEKATANKSPIESFLGITEDKTQNAGKKDSPYENNPCRITAEEYFNPFFDLNGHDIGRPKESSAKMQSFKAHLWLAEEYPLKLQEQVMPIVDLMAMSSSHFAKLKHFIEMQLPSGFPVKIEIPLFHILVARITFGNIFASTTPVTGVSTIADENQVSCIVDDEVFEIPLGYMKLVSSEESVQSRPTAVDEDDALLQYALQQSLMDSVNPSGGDQIDIWEALHASHPKGPTPDPPALNNHGLSLYALQEQQLQKAIEESLSNTKGILVCPSESLIPERPLCDSDLVLALSLSKQQQEEEEERRKQEEETLQKILELSLLEQ